MVQQKTVFIIIPAFNERSKVKELLISLSAIDPSFNVIIIDDGSNDGTNELVNGNGHIILKHQINLGQWAALRTGFALALKKGADILVTLDADGQHRPEDIPRILSPILENEADLVIGSRFLDDTRGMPYYRNWGIRSFNVLLKLTINYNLTDCTSGFKAYKRELLEHVLPNLSENQYGALESIIKISKLQPRIKEINIITIPSEKSSKGTISYGFHLLRTIIKSL